MAMAGDSPSGGGPTCTRAWSCGWYQCTPAGSSGVPSGTQTYSSNGDREPADPAARNSQVVYRRTVVRTTPADRCSSRDSCGRSNRPGGTSAVPATPPTAGADVVGSEGGSETVGNVCPSYRLKNQGKRSMSVPTKSRTRRG